VKPPLSLRGSARERARQIVERCGGGRERGSEWTVRCPAHDDRDPSLWIIAHEWHVGIHCYAGCTTEVVLHQLGLQFQDLFDDGSTRPPPPKRPKRLGPRIPEPPGGPTEDTIALQVALELIIEDCRLLEVEACQALFRRMAESPLMRLWIEQQLRRHRLDPALVWRIVQLSPTSATGGLRTHLVNPSPRQLEGGAL
jgi:hypothetical protein